MTSFDEPGTPHERSDEQDSQPEPAQPSKTTNPPPPSFAPTDPSKLPDGSWAVGHQEAGKIKFTGKAFPPDRSNAIALASMIWKTAHAIYEIAKQVADNGAWVAPPDVDEFAFSSAEIRFVVGENESVSLEGASPTISAGEKFAELLGKSGDDLLASAIELGQGANAYKQFVKAAAEAEADVEWNPGTVTSVKMTHQKASADLLALSREGTIKQDEFELPGRLTMTDTGGKFALQLPKGYTRHELVKGRRKVSGVFGDEVRHLISRNNLWGKDVLATVVRRSEVFGSTASPAEPTFELIKVEPAIAEVGPEPAVKPGDDPLF